MSTTEDKLLLSLDDISKLNRSKPGRNTNANSNNTGKVSHKKTQHRQQSSPYSVNTARNKVSNKPNSNNTWVHDRFQEDDTNVGNRPQQNRKASNNIASLNRINAYLAAGAPNLANSNNNNNNNNNGNMARENRHRNNNNNNNNNNNASSSSSLASSTVFSRLGGFASKAPLPGSVLLVTNLSPTVSAGDVTELFSTIGPIQSVMCQPTAACVTFVSPSHAQSAYNSFNNRLFDGQPMMITIQ